MMSPICCQNATDWPLLRHSPLQPVSQCLLTIRDPETDRDMLAQGLLLCAAVIALELLLFAAVVSGARSRNRTGTLLPARDFKSLVSTYFTIRACCCCSCASHCYSS